VYPSKASKYLFLQKVEQGCGDSPKKMENVLKYAHCDKTICNTKEFFVKNLFCLNKGKEEKNHLNGIKQCNKECFVFRDSDGKGKYQQQDGLSSPTVEFRFFTLPRSTSSL